MKRLTAFLIAIAAVLVMAWSVYGVTVSADAYALVDGDSGRVLCSSNGDDQLPMASTTKIMTAFVAIENGNLEDVVTIPKAAQGVEGSSLYLVAGETLTLKELLLGLMMHSGNDAAVAIAMHIGGSVEEFCDMMNEKAKELGANSTHFANPNGLPNDDHYTTAEDLGIIAAAAMRNDQFREIVSTMDATIPNDAQSWDRALTNKNKLLYSYQGANGVKTGYTKSAGRCLVGGALKENMQLITVVLNCGDMYNETANILDYGFEQYDKVCVLSSKEIVKEIEVAKSQLKSVGLTAVEDILVTLSEEERGQIVIKTDLPDKITAPLSAGTCLGTASVWLGERLMGETEIVCPVDIEELEWIYYLRIVAKKWLYEG